MKKLLSMVICFLVLFTSSVSYGYATENAMEPWQLAYLELLNGMRSDRNDSNSGDDKLESYALYDIDKDGTPEMFLRYGMSTASSKCFLYTFTNGTAAFVDQFYFGSSSLYSFPNKNGVLLVYWHMYHAKGELLSLSDGTLSSSLFFEEIIDPASGAWYRPVSDYCKGTVPITEFRFDQDFPLTAYYLWTQPVIAASEFYSKDEGKNFFVQTIIDNKTVTKVRFPFVAIALDGNDVEIIGLRDLMSSLTKTTTNESGERDSGESEYFVTDLNRDGQPEYMISHKKMDGPFASNQYMVILSEQDGTLYAYVEELHSFSNVDQNGVFYVYNDEFGHVAESAYRVFFDAESCMKVSCSLEDYSGPRGS